MMPCSLRRIVLLVLAWPAWTQAAGEAVPTCAIASTPQMPLLVELYTSEGCESCPPADRWLSALKERPDVVALAFHVDYWDRLGWKDRFANAAFSQRQSQQLRGSGARYVYTPQVLVDGLDQPAWRSLKPSPAAARPPAPVQVRLVRDGPRYVADVRLPPGAARRLGGFWAVTEDGHGSQVKAGENRGATLAHDFVVREYLPLNAWNAQPGSGIALQFSPTTPADPAHPRSVNLVLVDADSGRPVQAVRLAC